MKNVVLQNDDFELIVSTEKGLNPGRLVDRRTGMAYADTDYVYCLNDGCSGTPSLLSCELRPVPDGTEATFVGSLGSVLIRQRFFMPASRSYLEERVSLENRGQVTLETPKLALGFSKDLTGEGGRYVEGFDRWRLVTVPFRRDPLAKEGYEEYAFEELISAQGWYRLAPVPPGMVPRPSTPEFGAEGWVWTAGDGRALLVAKESNATIEHCMFKVDRQGGPRDHPVRLRFGGAGIWHEDPEIAHRIEPGQVVTFGVTRYALVSGGWKEGYYAFREFMDEYGHGVPLGFNPPVHWNELYDNPLWWLGQDNAENRERYYTLELLREEAEKARELGCESLYLDPGWDTAFASSVWDTERLGPFEEFVGAMESEFALKVSLHTPFAGWCDFNHYPFEARRMLEDGEVLSGSRWPEESVLCGASPAYLNTKSERLADLASKGAVFIMFDGSWYTGPCYDSSHGHSIPLTRQEHAEAILEVCRRVRAARPDVLIELHDPIICATARYAPVHYLHGLEGSFDEIWAFEFMWNPMESIVSGHAASLYYYNLAYGLPMYIHIDLRKDNEHAFMFWWYASTCRHMGVGGKPSDPKVWHAHKEAMQRYLQLKRFYTQGSFYGLEETVHAHTLRESLEAVINVFNLDEGPATKEVCFDLADIGLPGNHRVTTDGGEGAQEGSRVKMVWRLPGRGAAITKICCEAPDDTR